MALPYGINFGYSGGDIYSPTLHQLMGFQPPMPEEMEPWRQPQARPLGLEQPEGLSPTGPVPDAIRRPPDVLDRMAGSLPTYGMDVPRDVQRDALSRALITFGSGLIGQHDISALGPAILGGVEAHRGALIDADQIRRQNEYYESLEEDREARRAEAVAAEARRRAEEDQTEAERERERGRQLETLEQLTPDQQKLLRPLVGTGQFWVQYGDIVVTDPGDPYSANEYWRQRPDGIKERVRVDPKTGRVHQVLDAEGVPVLSHPTPQRDAAGDEDQPDLTLSGFNSLVGQMRGRLQREREDLEERLRDVDVQAVLDQRVQGQAPEIPSGFGSAGELMVGAQRLQQLQKPGALDDMAIEMANAQRQRVRSAYAPQEAPPGPPRRAEGPPSQARTTPPPLPPLPAEIVSRLMPEEASDPEYVRLVQALLLTKSPEEVLAYIERMRGGAPGL